MIKHPRRFVRKVYRQADSLVVGHGTVVIVERPDNDYVMGHGITIKEAWEDAAMKLEAGELLPPGDL